MAALGTLSCLLSFAIRVTSGNRLREAANFVNLMKQRVATIAEDCIRLWPIWIPLAVNLVVTISLSGQLVPFIDQDVYLDQARNLAAGKGLISSFDQLNRFVQSNEPTSFWGAGAQIFYAAGITLFGERYTLLRCLNLLLFAATLAYTRALFRLWHSQTVSNWGTFFIGLSPFFAAFNQLFMTEMPFLLCQQGCLYHLLASRRTQRTSHALLAGGWVGGSMVIRAVLVPVLPIFLLFLWLPWRWKLSLAFSATCLLVAGPYMIRNSMLVDSWFPFGGKGAYNLWFFNSDVHNKPFFKEDFLTPPPTPEWRGMNEKQRAALVESIGKHWIVTHPAAFIRLAAIKGISFLNPWPKQMARGPRAIIVGLYASLLLIGFICGAAWIRSTDPEHILILVIFISYLTLDMVFMPASRHRMLVDPLFVMVAGLAVGQVR